MTRRLPPLNALKAFEAAARHESFTRAAEELSVTQGAVSHQVKALERDLGLLLFERSHQRLTITAAGLDFVAVVRDAFDRIAFATTRLTQAPASSTLTVSTSPDFAAKWLVHRLGRFAELHPAIDLRLSAAMHRVDFARENIDIAVRHGDGQWPDLHAVQLCEERLFPVCSPRLIKPSAVRKVPPAQVLKFALLHMDDRSTWARWLTLAGVKAPKTLKGLVMNRASLLIDAAVDGQGVALARSVLAARDLINQRVVAPFALAMPLSNTYWIASPKATAEQTKIKTFRDWLLAEARSDMQQINKLMASAPRPRRLS